MYRSIPLLVARREQSFVIVARFDPPSYKFNHINKIFRTYSVFITIIISIKMEAINRMGPWNRFSVTQVLLLWQFANTLTKQHVYSQLHPSPETTNIIRHISKPKIKGTSRIANPTVLAPIRELFCILMKNYTVSNSTDIFTVDPKPSLHASRGWMAPVKWSSICYSIRSLFCSKNPSDGNGNSFCDRLLQITRGELHL